MHDDWHFIWRQSLPLLMAAISWHTTPSWKFGMFRVDFSSGKIVLGCLEAIRMSIIARASIMPALGTQACRCPHGRYRHRRPLRKLKALFIVMYLGLVVPVLGFQVRYPQRVVASERRALPVDPSVLSSVMDLVSSDSTNALQAPPPLLLMGLLLITPILGAVVQGGTAIVNYRKDYADAPLPRIPCHGVVIAGESLPSDDESLRLLVIGDSLAVGVGQSVSCTPVMPEAAASQISKATGKAVYWTCFGETGASTPWIIRMIEQANTQTYQEFNVPKEPRHGYSDFQAEGDLPSSEIEDWKKRLYTYRQSFRELYFDPDSWGPFDIVVLVTGTNDLKAAIFPFLLDEEDKELRRQIKASKGGLVEDVGLFIETLRRKMDRGLQSTFDKFLESAEELSQTLHEMELFFASNSTDAQQSHSTDSPATPAKESAVEQADDRENLPSISPLFVLPGSPIRLVPAFRTAPLQWFAVPIFDFMDNKKRDFASSNPCDILFVEDPSLKDAIDYESQRGRLWNDKHQEKIVLKVKDVSSRECGNIESEMKTYYESKHKLYDTVHSNTPLSEWPGIPGTKIFSVDGIHPNEAGYDMYGKRLYRGTR